MHKYKIYLLSYKTNLAKVYEVAIFAIMKLKHRLKLKSYFFSHYYNMKDKIISKISKNHFRWLRYFLLLQILIISNYTSST